MPIRNSCWSKEKAPKSKNYPRNYSWTFRSSFL